MEQLAQRERQAERETQGWKEGLTQATLSGVAWEAASVELVQMYDSVNQALIEEVLQWCTAVVHRMMWCTV